MNNFLLAFLLIVNLSMVILIFFWKKRVGDVIRKQRENTLYTM